MARNWSWQDDAACGSEEPELFFPEEERGAAKGVRESAAKSVCGYCPIREPCLEYALVTDQQWGIWGGLTPDERRRASLPSFPKVVARQEVA